MNVLSEMKVKKLIVMLVSLTLIFTSAFAFSGNKAHAAAPGTMLSNAVQVDFGETYFKYWTKDNDHLNHYSVFEVPSKGIVSINATKPFDSEGEYGTMSFALYDEEGNLVWGNDGYYSVDGVFDAYKMNVGLAPGTYYMTIKPGFSVYSGTIDTYYTLTHKADKYCEVEPNEGQYAATPLTLGKATTGYFGSDGFDDAEESDYYKVSMTKGNTYKVAVGNYGKISPTTILIHMITPDGDSECINNDIANLCDSDGRNYYNYTAETSGTHYIQVENYHKAQVKYDVVVSKIVKKTQTITTGAKSYTKKYGAADFYLKAKAKGNLTYTSSNEDVVEVWSDGEVWIEGIGKATITIKASATDLYKAATKKITVTVLPKTVQIKSLVNQKTKKMKVTWNMSADADGYQIQYATNKKFTKNKKTIKVNDKWEYDRIISKLSKKTYYVRMRTYATGEDGKTYYSDWSKTKSIKIKK